MIRKQPQTQAPALGLTALAVAGIVGFGALAGWAMPDKQEETEPWGTVHATDGDPAVAVPTDRPMIATLTTRFPILSVEQQYYQRMAEVLPRLPIAYGLTDEPIGFTDNQAAVFTALIYTESSFRPYDDNGAPIVSEVGCTGPGQLCGEKLTHEAIFNPARNIYIAADYFKQMIDEEDGNIREAIMRYKGVTTPDMRYVGDRVWEYLLIENVQ